MANKKKENNEKNKKNAQLSTFLALRRSNVLFDETQEGFFFRYTEFFL